MDSETTLPKDLYSTTLPSRSAGTSSRSSGRPWRLWTAVDDHGPGAPCAQSLCRRPPQTGDTTRTLMLEACSHVWIDVDDPPIARSPIAPVIGPGAREMHLDKLYRCQRCAATIMTQSPTPLSRSANACDARHGDRGDI
jgi:hypothetical protein